MESICALSKKIGKSYFRHFSLNEEYLVPFLIHQLVEYMLKNTKLQNLLQKFKEAIFALFNLRMVCHKINHNLLFQISGRNFEYLNKIMC